MPFPPHQEYLNEQSTYDNIMVANMVLEFEKEQTYELHLLSVFFNNVNTMDLALSKPLFS